jgi:predicted dehydrogenase
MLIEKPIAMTVEEAEVIIECARERGVVLAVGHIERFNPAVIKLKSCLGQGVLGRVFQIHARRLGPFPNRIEDVGVTIDLATHDLDIICYLTGAKVERVYAELGFRANGQHEDVLSAVLWFSDGTIGGLDVNWLTPTKVRELIVVGERGMFVLNYVTQDLFFYANRLENPSPQGHGASQGSAGTEGTRYCAGWQEPLRLELEAFAAAVRGETNLVVTGHEGLRALILAEAMLQAGGKHAVITL